MPVPTTIKILYLGSLHQDGNSSKRFETLKSFGYDVQGINVDDYIFGTIWMRFHFHLYIGPGIRALNKEVLRKTNEFKPDLIWVDNKPYLKSYTLNRIKEASPSVKILNLLTDDPFGKFHYAWRFIYHTFKLYDIHFVQREINISELKKWGAKRVETCFRSFDPDFHRKLELDNSQINLYKSKVGFIGSYESDREEYIVFLVQNGIDVDITGDGWENGKHWSLLKKYYKGPSVYGDEYVKVINGMEVALHFLRKANRDQQDSRTFEIPACGTFMLAERSNLHIEFFKEGTEADFFTSKEELLKKVNYYLQEEELRKSIAAAGYKRSFESGYDHKSRLEKIIEKIYQPSIPSQKMKRVVVAIYYDPDFYPPTINAIINLSTTCEELVVVTRNHTKIDFPYPGNVRLIKIGKQISVLESEKKNLIGKLYSFLSFTSVLFKQMKSKSTAILLIYDAIPLFSLHLMRKFISKNKIIWYHNHDMPNTHQVRKYSIGWFASKYEFEEMKKIDYFSLPSDDRLVYYPNWKDMSRYLSIPNYPSLKVYRNNEVSKFINDEIRIIFQGTIGEEHALEELISILKEKVGGKNLRLILKGGVRPHYKKLLSDHAEKFGVTDRIEWVGLGAYCELPPLTLTCHIGIAIYMGTDKVRLTLGTASNKIYEYAASGLPVILYDNNQFRKHLESYNWAYFTDGTAPSLIKCLEAIFNDYNNLSNEARKSFEDKLNFEKSFSKVISRVISK